MAFLFRHRASTCVLMPNGMMAAEDFWLQEAISDLTRTKVTVILWDSYLGRFSFFCLSLKFQAKPRIAVRSFSTPCTVPSYCIGNSHRTQAGR